MYKKISRLLVVSISVPICIYCTLVWQNNRSVPPPSQLEIAASWESGVAWLSNNRQSVLQDTNPILWWMIGESAKLSGDSRLQLLFDEFRNAMNAGEPDSVWQTFFTPERYWGANFQQQSYVDYADYQQYFLFGLTCSKQLAAEPIIAAQQNLDFCRRTHPLSPACGTHQLMGFRFAQRSGCDRVEKLTEKINALQDTVVRQLRWDPRVVDVYLQRVLMLVESGAPEKIKPLWLRRVIAAQLSEGSWSNVQPLIPVGNNRYLSFNEKLLGVDLVAGNLHATAQGIWLLSLLRQDAAYKAMVHD